MSIPEVYESEIQKIGGESLSGSGFEDETPATDSESEERRGAEDVLQ